MKTLLIAGGLVVLVVGVVVFVILFARKNPATVAKVNDVIDQVKK
jgi:Sec-independent protein translocase protein TatA